MCFWNTWDEKSLGQKNIIRLCQCSKKNLALREKTVNGGPFGIKRPVERVRALENAFKMLGEILNI